MKKLFLTTLILLAIGVTSCVKDDPYVEPEVPEIPDSPLKGSLVLNEINGCGDDAEKYIELYNNSDAEIDLAGVVIYYNNVSSEPAVTWIGTTQKISAKGFLLLKGTKSGTNPGHDLSTGLSGTQSINVEIRDENNERVDVFQVPADANRVKSYARIPDGTGSWYYDAPTGTPGTTNGNVTTGKMPIVSVPVITDLVRSIALPTPTDDVVISAKVLAEEGTSLTKVVLEWTKDALAQTAITMVKDGDIYSATIPMQTNGTIVSYIVVATNNKGGNSVLGDGYTVSDGSTASKGKVYINECDPEKKQWEIYNSEDFDINLTGWKMSKDNDAPTFTFGAGTVIAAKGFLVLTQNEDNSPTFGMSATKGFKYDLFNSDDEEVDSFDNFETNQFNDNIIAGYTVGRRIDGDSQLVTFSKGSMGKTNSDGIIDATASALVINEIDGNGKFVEIYNNSDKELSLEGVTLHKNEKGTWWTGQTGTKIAAKGYYTIVQADQTTVGADEYTGDSGISPKQCLKFELKGTTGELLDEFVRTKAGTTLGDSCTPDYGSGTQYSFSCCPDGTGEFGLAVPSCNEANPATSAGPILVD